MRSTVKLSMSMALLAGWMQASAQAAVDFESQVKPILESTCLSCHNANDPKGKLRLDTRAEAFKGGEYGKVIVPGEPNESPLYTLTILPPGDVDIMPPKGDPLTKAQTEILRQWILEGANWPEGVTLAQQQRVNFVEHVQPLLELNCLACHRSGNAKGGLMLDTRESAFATSEHGRPIVPGRSSASLLYTAMILPEDHDDVMPPANKGGPLPKETSDIIRFWIDQGAQWPEGLTLTPKKSDAAGADGDEALLISQIHSNILAKEPVSTEAEMQPYENTIPETDITYSMVPIPGGEFVMGSPEDEEEREEDEGPLHRVRVAPFWMGKTEVTWDEFELFMYPAEEKKLRELRGSIPDLDQLTDALARPTQPYVEMSFGMGKDGYPAISMTQYAAVKYCQWLSAKTGHFYRLPTEAEWEYACRAGTATAYFWGDDPDDGDDYAWYAENSDWKYQKVGVKKPNPWGLFDMHGNVAEWTMDQYDEEFYQQFTDGVADNPWNQPVTLYPRVARGGSWEDDPPMLRSANRIASHPDWKMQDPQLPKSIWYLTDAQFLGFRIVRPLKVPTPEELAKYWPAKSERDF